jgi:hypothetical protein
MMMPFVLGDVSQNGNLQTKMNKNSRIHPCRIEELPTDILLETFMQIEEVGGEVHVLWMSPDTLVQEVDQEVKEVYIPGRCHDRFA